ncbi:MAG: hypothetical protein R3185_08635 [Candidatus Thermoplasmatota archaeon]|nr:hypothetical protein [Candidatus Thermoplasmatota archaeon]
MAQRRQGNEQPAIDERIEELQRVVSLLVYKLDKEFGCSLDFTPRSVPYLDAVLTEAHRKGGQLTPGLYLSIGGYLGETLVRNFGGTWVDVDGMLTVSLPGQAHTRFVRVFDWVQDAYQDPRTRSLTFRMQSMAGTGIHHGSGRFDPDQASA